MQPETRYTKSGDLDIAYQVVGSGPIDLLFVTGFVSHLDLQWTDPALTAFLRGLAKFSRLILFDKAGVGLSDPIPNAASLEARMDDARAVLEASGSTRTVLFGFSEGAPLCALFAATYPERTAALILYGSFARWAPEKYPASAGVLRSFTQALHHWGSGETLGVLAPTLAGDRLHARLWGIFERAGASPRMVQGVVEALTQIDVTDILPSIQVPTLVLHRTEDVVFPVEEGRAVAAAIPGAQFKELAGRDHLPWVGDSVAVLREVEQFLTGSTQVADADRALMTIVFTDIVGSTEQAARLGDLQWRQRLDHHDALVRRLLERFRGREVVRTGDGFLAVFDGPARGIRWATALVDEVTPLGLEVRVGIHTGECERLGNDIGGIAVHLAARIAAEAAPSEVLTSSTVKDLVFGSGVQFRDRGLRALRGIPGEWRLYSVNATNVPSPSLPDVRTSRVGAIPWIARHASWLPRFVLRARGTGRRPSG